jgi:hypothetical protein
VKFGQIEPGSASRSQVDPGEERGGRAGIVTALRFRFKSKSLQQLWPKSGLGGSAISVQKQKGYFRHP